MSSKSTIRVWVLALLVGCGSPPEEPASRPPASQEPGDTLEPATLAPADTPPATNTPELTERERLERDVAHLRQLLAGELPVGIEMQSLFLVDLRNEAAVEARLAVLRGERSTSPLRDGGSPVNAPPVGDGGVRAADGGEVADPADAGPPSEDASLATAHGDVATPVDAGGIADAGAILDGAVSADGGVAAAAADDDMAAPPADDLEPLRRERDRLRLEFLSLPAARRATIVETTDARRTLALAEVESAAALQQARADEDRANEQRQRALDQAALSSSIAERALLAERARVEEERSQLARTAGRMAERRTARNRTATHVLELEHTVGEHLASTERFAADATYDRVVDALREARDALEGGLADLSADSEIQPLEQRIDTADAAYQSHRALREELAAAYLAYEQSASVTADSEGLERWDSVEAVAERVRSLDLLRIQLLPRLTPAKRDAVLGLGPEGLAQLQRELRQARLMMWWEAEGMRRGLPLVPGQLATWFGAAGTRWVLIFIGALFLGLVMLYRERERLADRVGRALRSRQREARWAALLAPWWGSLAAVFEPLVTMGVLLIIWRLAESLGDSTAVTVVARLALLLAGYRVARAAASELLSSRLRVGDRRNELRPRIRRDVGLVLGFVAVSWAVLTAADLLVGRGYLYSLVVDLALWTLVPIVAILFHRWAPQTAIAYRERYPGSRIARALRPEGRRVERVLAVPPASLRLLLDGSFSALRELALRFEGSRRAVAFLFRRKLERELRPNTASIEALPEQLKGAFSPKRDDLSDAELVAHFPGIEAIVVAAQRFRDGGRGTGVALVGESGAGKSTWVQHLFEEAEIEPARHGVPHDLRGRAGTCRWLCEVLEIPPCDDVDGLVAALPEDAHKAILIEDAHNLILRCVGGTAAVRTLVETIGRTSDRVLWVATFSRLTWRYLERARQSQELFEHVLALEGWPESNIAELIRARVNALGYAVSFVGLVVDRLEGTAFENAVVRSEEEFYRLLWDYSDGNPRVALHFFLRSVASLDDERLLKIQLFDAPDPDGLESLHEQSRFVLAAVALHESLTVAEGALVTTFSRSDVAAILTLLESRGILEIEGEHYRLRTHWFRAVMRYLRRKQLLFS